MIIIQHLIIMWAGSQSETCVLSYAALQRVASQTRPVTCVQGHFPKTGRDREALLRMEVPHFAPSSESYRVMGDCYLNSKVLQLMNYVG